MAGRRPVRNKNRLCRLKLSNYGFLEGKTREEKKPRPRNKLQGGPPESSEKKAHRDMPTDPKELALAMFRMANSNFGKDTESP